MTMGHGAHRFGRLALALLAITAFPLVRADDATARTIMAAVAARAEPARMQANLKFELRTASGDIQVREALLLRRIGDGYTRVAMYFSAPRALRGSSFLAWNGASAQVEDEQWLYLPSLSRVRRIPGRDRGQAFLGTDLSYGDIQVVAKIELSDWSFVSARQVEGDLWQVEARGATPDMVKETGYARVRWTVDRQRAFPMKSEYWDAADQPLKVVEYRDLQERDGSLQADTIAVSNLRNGHGTQLSFSAVKNNADATFDDELLTPARLSRAP